jgi:hypothetical protein
MTLLPIHREDESCSDPGRVLVLNDPLATITHNVSHAPIYIQSLLLSGPPARPASSPSPRDFSQ